MVSVDGKNLGDRGPLDPPDAHPLFGHGHQRLNAGIDSLEPLAQCGMFPVGRHHQKRSKSLQKHRDHSGLNSLCGLMKCFHVLNDWSELRRRDKVRRPRLPEICEDSAHDGNSPVHLTNESLVHLIEIVQDSPDPIHSDTSALLLGFQNDGIEHVASRLHGS